MSILFEMIDRQFLELMENEVQHLEPIAEALILAKVDALGDKLKEWSKMRLSSLPVVAK